MDKTLERDIQTLQRTEGNLRFLFQSYVDGRVSYELAKVAISHEARFLERLIEVRIGMDYVLLTTLWDLKNGGTENNIINDCATLSAVSIIVLEKLKEVRDK